MSPVDYNITCTMKEFIFKSINYELIFGIDVSDLPMILP